MNPAIKRSIEHVILLLLGFACTASCLANTQAAEANNTVLIDAVRQLVIDSKAETQREKQKQAILMLSLERAQSAEGAGDTELCQELLRETAGLINNRVNERPDPDFSGNLLPDLHTPEDNPYLDALYKWVEARIDKPDIPFKKASKDVNPFTGLHHAYGTRDEAANMNRYFWLAVHPESRYRGNPEVFAHLFRRAHAYVDAHSTHAIRMQDSTNGHLTNDFFAIGPAIEAMLKTRKAFPDLLLPGDLTRWEKMVRQTYDFWLDQYQKNQQGTYRMGRYANRDIAVANILLACGLYLDEKEGVDAARILVLAQKDNLYPDGAYAYIGTQNESCGYHSACTMFLTRYYHLTGEGVALDLLKASQWYGPLSVEPGNVSDFWTSPSWKHSWNSGVGIGGETVAHLSGNQYERAILNRHIAKRGPDPDPRSAMWYRGDIKAAPQPDNYVVLDRNILGPRGRFGRFSYAANLRIPDNSEPGNATIMGAMTTETDIDQFAYPLEAVLAEIMPRVFVETTPKGRHKRPDWAYLSCREQNAASVGRDWSGVHSTYRLHSFGSSRKGQEVPWEGSQIWIGVGDRLFGLLEVAPVGNQEAFEVALGATLGYGGHGERRPKELITHGPEHWELASLNLKIHKHNFNTVRLEKKKIRVSPASWIVCSTRPDDQSISNREETKRGSDTLQFFSPDRPYYVIAEVFAGQSGPKAEIKRIAKDTLQGLSVKINDARYTLLLNRSDQPLAVDLKEHGLASDHSWVHFPRSTDVFAPKILSNNRLTIPAGQHRMILHGQSNKQANQAGWDTFEAMIRDFESQIGDE